MENRLDHSDQSQFGIADPVVFKAGPNDLPVVDVLTEHCSACIALQGAQLLHWTPAGEEPVIWLSPAAKFCPGKSVRGGVPICWPWFGPHPNQSDFPAHGFARSANWETITSEPLADGRIRIEFRLIRDETSMTLWPHMASLQVRYTLGQSLEIELLTRNEGSEPFRLSEALHTYFAVSNILDAAVTGLDGCDFIDRVGGDSRGRQSGVVAFARETDRIYLDTPSECSIEDPGWRRRILIETSNSRSTVVWNPWVEKAAKLGDMGETGYLGMVCVESGNAAANTLTLNAGDEHCLQARYSVESLP